MKVRDIIGEGEDPVGLLLGRKGKRPEAPVAHPPEYGDVVGIKVGRGGQRNVYRHAARPDLVIKMMRPDANLRNGWHQNRMEWVKWQAVQGTSIADCFAPCVEISADGTYLMQRRVEPAARYDDFDHLPKIFLFFEPAARNIGTLAGRPVLCDYALAAAPIEDILRAAAANGLAETLPCDEFFSIYDRWTDAELVGGFDDYYEKPANLEWILRLIREQAAKTARIDK